MTTSKTLGLGSEKIETQLPDSLGGILPEPRDIAAMAQTYFPELGGFVAPSTGSETLSHPGIADTVPDPESTTFAGQKHFSEDDFLKAISAAFESEKEERGAVFSSLPSHSEEFSRAWHNEPTSYSFLDSTRTIFAEAEPKADLKAKDDSSRKLIISPQVVPVLNTNEAFFDVAAIRRDFPILSEKVNGKNLIWLDNAATTQKPKAVIDRLRYFYEHENSNVHRGAHTLAARSTDAYEEARAKIAKFLNASSANEIVFVRGATEAINLLAHSWGKSNIQRGDEIIISHLEHHANIVPWQILAAETGANIRIIPVDNNGQILLSEYQNILGPRTRLVAVTHVSNALGTITPVADIVQLAHRYNAKVLIDGAQSVSHIKVDVQSLDADFFVFSGHKIFGPTGIGALYGKKEILDSLPPYQSGGNMIADVTFEKTLYQAAPLRFEAGTGNIADAVGLGAALDYVNSIGIENIARYEHHLLQYGTQTLSRIPGLRIIGTAREKASVLSFVLEGYTTEEIGKALSQEGIAVRSGHHCAQPILRRFGLESTVRPSLSFYNTCEEIDALAAVVWRLKRNR